MSIPIYICNIDIANFNGVNNVHTISDGIERKTVVKISPFTVTCKIYFTLVSVAYFRIFATTKKMINVFASLNGVCQIEVGKLSDNKTPGKIPGTLHIIKLWSQQMLNKWSQGSSHIKRCVRLEYNDLDTLYLLYRKRFEKLDQNKQYSSRLVANGFLTL